MLEKEFDELIGDTSTDEKNDKLDFFYCAKILKIIINNVDVLEGLCFSRWLDDRNYVSQILSVYH